MEILGMRAPDWILIAIPIIWALLVFFVFPRLGIST